MPADRFFPRFELELDTLPGESLTETAKLRAAVNAFMPLNRNFYEADVKVIMRYALTGNRFEITVAGLTNFLFNAIKPGKTTVEIQLGYYAGDDNQVLEGVILEKTAEAGSCFYETKLKGVEKAHYLLQKTCLRHESESDTRFNFPEGHDIGEILDRIHQAADVPLRTPPGAAGDQTRIPRPWSFHQKTALDGLKQVQRRLRRIEGYSLSLHNGTIWYGRANGNGTDTGDVYRTAYSHENYLVKTKPVHKDRGGRPSRCAQEDEENNHNGSDSDVLGYDFEMLGDPRLKPGDTVTFELTVDGEEVSEELTIESVIHDYSRARGYRCTGRALKRTEFLQRVFGAMAPGAETAGEEINNVLARNQERSPAVNIGDITEYIAEEHVANACLGLRFEPTMTSPSIQVRRDAEGFALERRPLVSPFAWNLCGLIVPVYAGMRAVAVHNRYLREDALLDGFLWTEEMEPPPSEAGDYWLCLPLDVPDDRPPNESDKGVTDLTTGDGKRVIQLKGLRITVGEGLLEDLGTRPTNLGADDELQIEHSSGAKITMKADEIKLEAGGRTLDISGGKVNIT